MANKEIVETMISAREEYIDIIKSELLGPGSEFSLPDAEHEIISASPSSRYSIGILFPQGNLVNQDNDETVPLNGNDNEATTASEIFENNVAETDIHKSVNRNYIRDETVNENLDEEIGMSRQYMPSSMGITFLVRGDCNAIRGKLNFATYRRAQIADCMLPYHPENPKDYALPPELADLMEFDGDNMLLKLKKPVKASEVRDIFERDIMPKNDLLLFK